MKGRIGEKLLSQVAQAIPEKSLQVKGSLLFRAPIRDLLCGLWLDSSGFSADAFYPTVFVQPMFEKSSYLVLSLGDRFLGNWSSGDPLASRD